MVLEYYKLREQPFGVTPDARYLYASATHREALASLLYGVQVGRGFVALIAKPGMGKTTLLFRALQQLQSRAKVVFLFQTIYTPVDFLRAVLSDLGVAETQGSFIDLQLRLNQVLTELSRAGKPLVVIIDEAQNLDDSVLELVRMLSNFETSREKLIQIILSGQPQLADKLSSPRLLQLRQRISIFACLKPFSAEETALYIDHRLRTAGYSADAPLFTPGALELIAKYSEGIPRNINNLCFNALSIGCALKRKTIDCDILSEVIGDFDLEPLRENLSPAPRPEHNAAQLPQVTVPAASASPMLNAWPEALPPRPEQNVAQQPRVPIFTAASASPILKVWPWKLGVASAVLACVALGALGGVIFQSHRSTAIRSSISDAKPAPSPATAKQAPQVATASLVRVTPGQTLYWICVENFGSCNAERLQEIHTLNPWLSDLNHIETGQTIRVPIVQGALRPTQSSAEPSGHELAQKRDTNE